jgi:hypothetical protein
VLEQVSAAALRYGAALEIDDPLALAMRLYGFNRHALSPRLVMSLPGPHELREFVLKEGPPELTSDWRSRRRDTRGGWLGWIRRDEPGRAPAVAYKLFVSPAPTAVREALSALVPELTRSRCFHFKVGATPADLARPDKIVAYFDDRAETLRVAELVRTHIDGLPAHGVPFSCPIDDGGLLSWGVDPPHGDDEATSWRARLCSEMAAAMTAAAPDDRVAAARERVVALGIDPDRFEPSPGIWRDRGSH